MRHEQGIRAISDEINNIQDRISDIDEGKLNDRFYEDKLTEYRIRLTKQEMRLTESLKLLIDDTVLSEMNKLDDELETVNAAYQDLSKENSTMKSELKRLKKSNDKMNRTLSRLGKRDLEMMKEIRKLGGNYKKFTKGERDARNSRI